MTTPTKLIELAQNIVELNHRIDEQNREIEQLLNKYEAPGQKCNRGHINGLPIKLWDCPMCTEELKKEIKRLKEDPESIGYYIDTCFWQEETINRLLEDINHILMDQKEKLVEQMKEVINKLEEVEQRIINNKNK